MLLNLSILPICLLLLHSVNSVDVSYNKRVPRRQTQVIRSYNSNHPPIVETKDKIPVAVVYDDEDVIKVINKNGREADEVVDEETSLKVAPPDNHPTSGSLHKSLEVDVSERESNVKPRARSIQISEAESDDTKVSSTESTTPRRVIKKRKRVQNVRRVPVNQNQRKVQVSESKNSESQVTQKVLPTTTERSRSTVPAAPAPHTFPRRQGTRDPVVPIIDSENYVFSHSGDFHYSYEGGDGTRAYERGELRKSEDGAGSAVEGSFSYKDKDGNDVSLSYTADENGYRPVGAHLPTPPPIPPEIARALAYLATKTTPEPVTERLKTL
ncbi:hypothetical protein PYW08_014795 [Mythimna loreyi]|uniref:Uncharacterized protein n=1 Tax=Mythimna loreyi TaxID=667449 RepID=A0ACC2R541_9NEOP|nr:hypothetical protein PYW08_014795 [Mythimna loreyi]